MRQINDLPIRCFLHEPYKCHVKVFNYTYFLFLSRKSLAHKVYWFIYFFLFLMQSMDANVGHWKKINANLHCRLFFLYFYVNMPKYTLALFLLYSQYLLNSTVVLYRNNNGLFLLLLFFLCIRIHYIYIIMTVKHTAKTILMKVFYVLLLPSRLELDLHFLFTVNKI